MDNISEINDEIRWKLLKLKVLEEQIVTLFKIFRGNDIEPILLKGWAAGLYYPRHFERVFSDIDLAVSPAEFEKASGIVKEFDLTVDLHDGFRKLDTLSWEHLFNNSVIEKIADYEIRILCPEDHLRVLCVHWLIDGGIYKEKLLDMFYLIEKSGDSFDWDKCLNVVNLKRQSWIINTIGLLEKYFGLDIERLPFKDRIGNMPMWFIETLEKEWQNPVPLRPLQTCLSNRSLLFTQIRKRVPPNKIQATVEMEGAFDDSSRLRYQINSMFYRILPSVKRIFKTLLTGDKY